MLAVAAALSRTGSSSGSLSRATLTLAASLSCASPFDFRAARDPASEASRVGKRAFESSDGDPFTARCAFEAWVLAKASKPASAETRGSKRGGGPEQDRERGGSEGDVRAASRSSRAWCARHGLQESRLYEIAKLRAQLDAALKHTLRFSAPSSAAPPSGGGGLLAPVAAHPPRAVAALRH
jgi:hypothetical protein